MSRRNIWQHVTKQSLRHESRPDTLKKCPIPPPPDLETEDETNPEANPPGPDPEAPDEHPIPPPGRNCTA